MQTPSGGNAVKNPHNKGVFGRPTQNTKPSERELLLEDLETSIMTNLEYPSPRIGTSHGGQKL